MKYLVKFLKNPLLVVSLLLGTSLLYMKEMHYKGGDMIVFFLTEIFFIFGFGVLALLLTEGLQTKNSKYKATIMVENNNCYDTFSVLHFKSRLGAKISVNIQIWACKQFGTINPKQGVTYILSH